MASIFSGSAGRKASQAANDVLGKGLGLAQTQLTDAHGAAANILNQNQNIYQNSYEKAQGLMDSAYGNAMNQAGNTADLYQPFYNSGVQANHAYANAMGLNGAEGYAQAMQDFRSAPGYQFQMDQGLDAINRTAAARGGLASGNNSVDLLKYATGLADQGYYQNYVGNLNNQVNTGMQAASGMANAQQGLAQMTMNYGNQSAALAQDHGNQLAGINNTLAGNQIGLGNSLSGNTMNTFQKMSENTGQGMMAGQTAASNRFGAVMGAAQAGMGLLGMM